MNNELTDLLRSVLKEELEPVNKRLDAIETNGKEHAKRFDLIDQELSEHTKNHLNYRVLAGSLGSIHKTNRRKCKRLKTEYL